MVGGGTLMTLLVVVLPFFFFAVRCEGVSLCVCVLCRLPPSSPCISVV